MLSIDFKIIEMIYGSEEKRRSVVEQQHRKRAPIGE
jgi:hypothetical protein